MAVRAKFFCSEIRRTTYGGGVTLTAVSRGEDNKKWASATPSGKLEMTILNELAVEFFDVGEEYYIDISSAPKGEEGMGE